MTRKGRIETNLFTTKLGVKVIRYVKLGLGRHNQHRPLDASITKERHAKVQDKRLKKPTKINKGRSETKGYKISDLVEDIVS